MSALFYLASIVAANILISIFHLVTVFGITFPAGAALIGLTFSARDLVQKRYGKWGCWVWMIAACAITALFNWQIALASCGAFLVAEGADWAIYSLLSHKSLRYRIIVSNIVGTPLDSAVFVALAFGWFWPAVWGQTLVKFASSLLVLPFLRNRS